MYINMPARYGFIKRPKYPLLLKAERGKSELSVEIGTTKKKIIKKIAKEQNKTMSEIVDEMLWYALLLQHGRESEYRNENKS